MRRFWRKLSTFFFVAAIAALCASIVCAEDSAEKAREVLENVAEKYRNLLEKDGAGLKSLAAKVSVKGGGQMPMGASGGTMPLELDLSIELYVVQPGNLYLDISGNLGSAAVVLGGEERKTATIILPHAKQFATVDLPENFMQPAQEGDPEEPDEEDFWEKVVLAYEGKQSMEAGAAHKINIKPKDSTDASEESSITVYILDGKWDPVRLEANSPEGDGAVIDFEKLELNAQIPDERFVADTGEYAMVPGRELLSTVLMQIMSTMMQKDAN